MFKKITLIFLIVITSMFVANYITLKSQPSVTALQAGNFTGDPDDLQRCKDAIKACNEAIKDSESCSTFLKVITFGYYCRNERLDSVVKCTLAKTLCKIAA